MSRPSVTFVLFLAIALFIVLNDAVGDTWIGATLPVRAVDWYKTLVPLPYVAMLAIIHARRTAGPRWFEAALLAALAVADLDRVRRLPLCACDLRRRSLSLPRPLRLLVGRALSAAGADSIPRASARRLPCRASSFQSTRGAQDDRSFERVSSFSPTTAPPCEAQVFPTPSSPRCEKTSTRRRRQLDNRAQCCGLFLPILSPRGSASCSATPPRNRFMKLR